ncbi:protein-tyrosine phosphatase-like protein [Globomyces pollinis-pini]|nr:protein-tyrosine phosphatase-like protein [Globomyces pollinis-pini]
MNAICPTEGLREISKKKVKTKQGRPVDLYPDDIDLPWHYSWVDDDKMIGGTSIPCERFNYPPIIKSGVKLIVNLTESAVTPNNLVYCDECHYDGSEVLNEPDIFDDVNPSDDLKVLFLPIPDGFVPAYEQVEIFLKYSEDTIEKGGKVMVHCHAGVGRTGTLLAIYLMKKYNIGPAEAIQRLRHSRPQSLQFCPEDWFTDPFFIRHESSYTRNYLQERFVERYYYDRLVKEKEDVNTMDSKLSRPRTISNTSSVATLTMQRTSSISSSGLDSDCSDDSIEPEVPEFTEKELDEEIDMLLEKMTSVKIVSEKSNRSLCSICMNVKSVGPDPIIAGQPWPSPNAKVEYF